MQTGSLKVVSHRALMESVASQLVSVEHRPEGAFITTPLQYPSGSLVVVRVDASQSSSYVTDMGGGYLEADMMGTSLIYARNAKLIAEDAGLHFDHQAFSIGGISRDQLPGAIIAIANASLQAVATAAFRQAEKKAAAEADFLYERLVRVFKPLNVNRDVQIIGASNTSWKVANVVRFDQKVSVFEPVSNHPNSITTATAKFHDIARLDDAPNRVAVVHDKKALGTYLAVLSQAANVVAQEVSDETLRRLAA